jgi:hypothetical protein
LVILVIKIVEEGLVEMDKKLKKYYFVNGCKRNRRYNRVVNAEKDYKDKRYHNLNHNEDLL